MGWQSGGGQNRTHDCIHKYKRLDSFDFGKIQRNMPVKRDCSRQLLEWPDGNSVATILHPDRVVIKYTTSSNHNHAKICDTICFDRSDILYIAICRGFIILPSNRKTVEVWLPQIRVSLYDIDESYFNQFFHCLLKTIF